MRVRAALGTGLSWSAYYTGALQAAMRFAEPLNGSTPDGRFQILVYHRVGEDVDPYVQGTPVAVFERHLRYLCRHFRILSLADLVLAARRREVPARAIAITFDDGYEDTYSHVLPIVRRYEVPITVYLATGLIDEGRPMWNERIATAIRYTSCERLQAVPGCDPLPLATATQRRRTLERVLGLLKPRRPAERDELTEQIVRALGVTDDRAPRMLRWAQVRKMREHGVEFGAHTVNHPILSALSAAEAYQEIVESKRVIEEQIQTPVEHFAYPNGTSRDFDETTKNLVRTAGFLSAVSMIFGINTTGTDPYELRRGGPWEEAIAPFATKLWWYRRRGRSDANSSA
jgi:peptidoglycan/xylan/chitin deacetylase (PgdA/CDA1 family)